MIRLPYAVAAAFLAAVASQAPPAALAQAGSGDTKPGEIKGQDVMGDKGKSAQDGWVQAPIPREESASKAAPDPGGTSIGENANRPVPAANPSSAAGGDPQQPLDHRTPGPSGDNPASPSK